jgi:hypothetical protein
MVHFSGMDDFNWRSIASAVRSNPKCPGNFRLVQRLFSSPASVSVL